MRTPVTRRLAIVAAAMAMTTAACGDRPDPLDFGFKRVSLDLVFKDAAKAPPVDAQKVTRIVEFYENEYAGYEYEEEEPEPPRRRIVRSSPRTPPEPPCGQAPPGETPLIPALSAMHEPPREGAYRRSNVGTIRITVPPLFDFPLPYPFRTRWTITELSSGIGTIATGPREDENLPLEAAPKSPDPTRANPIVAPEVHRFKLTRKISDDSMTVDTYQYYGDRGSTDLDSTEYDGDGIYLVKREWFSARFGNRVFEPTPPVMVTAIGDEHEDAAEQVDGVSSEQKRSSGVDRSTGASLTIESRIMTREDIDVCGEVVGTYRVEFDEIFVDMSSGTPQVSGTIETGKKNVWNISFNRGLLLAREEVHRIDRMTLDGVPASVTYDYVSTLMNTEPEPLEAP